MANQFAITAALVNGLQQGIAQARREKQAAELQKLMLLSRSPGYELQPAAPGEVQPTNWLGKLFGQEFRPSSTGAPVIGVGGTPFVARQEPLLQDTPAGQAIMAGGRGAAPAVGGMAPLEQQTQQYTRTQTAPPPASRVASVPSEPTPEETLGEIVARDELLQAYAKLPYSQGAPKAEARLKELRTDYREQLRERQKTQREEAKALDAAKTKALGYIDSLGQPAPATRTLKQKVAGLGQIEDINTLLADTAKATPGIPDYGLKDADENTRMYEKYGDQIPAGGTPTREMVRQVRTEVQAEKESQRLRVAKAGRTQVNVGPSGIDYGKPPEDMAWARNADGTVKLTYDEESKSHVPMAIPIARSPLGIKIKTAENKTASSKEQQARQGDIVTEDISRVLDLVENSSLPVTGMIGSWLSNISETGASDARELLEGISANVTFDKIQQMRESSPTGAALGPVSDFENKRLAATLGSLQQRQSRAQFVFNLRRAHDVYLDTIHGKGNGPPRLLHERSGPGGTPAPTAPPGPATAPVPSIKDTPEEAEWRQQIKQLDPKMTDADIDALMPGGR